MTPFLLRLHERRLAGRVPASRLSPLLGDLLEDYHERRTARHGWRGWIAAQIWLARECSSMSSAYRARPAGTHAPHHHPRLLTLLDDLRQDVRDARRTFVRHPGFTAVAILTLMLGIGANAAIFSVVHGILFGLTPLDPTMFITASLLFAAVAALASWIPARRATRIEPVIALRGE